MEIEEEEYAVEMQLQAEEILPSLVDQEVKIDRRKIAEQVQGSELEALQQELNQVMAEEQEAAERERASLEADHAEDEEEVAVDEERNAKKVPTKSVKVEKSSPMKQSTNTTATVSQSQQQAPVVVATTSGQANGPKDASVKSALKIVSASSSPEKSDEAQPKKTVVVINADRNSLALSNLNAKILTTQSPAAKQKITLENGEKSTSNSKSTSDNKNESVKPFRVELDDE